MAVPTVAVLTPINVTESGVDARAEIIDTGGLPVTQLFWDYRASCCLLAKSEGAAINAPQIVTSHFGVLPGEVVNRYSFRAENADGRCDWTDFEWFTSPGTHLFPSGNSLPAVGLGTVVRLRGEITDLAVVGCSKRGFRYKRGPTGAWTYWTESGTFGLGVFEHEFILPLAGTYYFQARFTGYVAEDEYPQILWSPCGVGNFGDELSFVVPFVAPSAPFSINKAYALSREEL